MEGRMFAPSLDAIVLSGPLVTPHQGNFWGLYLANALLRSFDVLPACRDGVADLMAAHSDPHPSLGTPTHTDSYM